MMFFRGVLLVACLVDFRASETVGLISSAPNVNFLAGDATRVTSDGPFLALSGGQRIGVLNVAGGNSSSPRILNLGASVWNHFQSRSTIFANVDTNSALAIVDFSTDPPVTVYRGKPDLLPELWAWNGVIRVDDHLHVANYRGLTSLDISDLAAPRVIQHLNGGPSGGLARRDDFLFMGVHGTGFAVYKLGEDGTPRLENVVTISGTEFILDVAGNLLAVAVNHLSGSSFSEMWFYDVTDPLEPITLGWGPASQELLGMRLEDATLFTLSYARLRAYDISEATAAVERPGPRPLAMPLVGYRYDFDKGFIGLVAQDETNVLTLGAEGVSFWKLQRAAPRLTVRREDLILHLEWTAPVPGPYEVQSQTDLSSTWTPLAVTSSNSLSIPLPDAAASRYHRIRVLPR